MIKAITKTLVEMTLFQVLCFVLKTEAKAKENINIPITMMSCPSSKPRLKAIKGATIEAS